MPVLRTPRHAPTSRGFAEFVEGLPRAEGRRLAAVRRFDAALPALAGAGADGRTYGQCFDACSLAIQVEAIAKVDAAAVRALLDINSFAAAKQLLSHVQSPARVLVDNPRYGGLVNDREVVEILRLLPQATAVHAYGPGHEINYVSREFRAYEVEAFAAELDGEADPLN
jgi:hypothetical protein